MSRLSCSLVALVVAACAASPSSFDEFDCEAWIAAQVDPWEDAPELEWIDASRNWWTENDECPRGYSEVSVAAHGLDGSEFLGIRCAPYAWFCSDAERARRAMSP